MVDTDDGVEGVPTLLGGPRSSGVGAKPMSPPEGGGPKR